jgi:hypothetical protein
MVDVPTLNMTLAFSCVLPWFMKSITRLLKSTLYAMSPLYHHFQWKALYIENGHKRVSLEVLLKIVDEFDLSLDNLVLEESHVRLPKVYRAFAELLADCDIEEQHDILKTASAYKKLRREGKHPSAGL